MKKILILITFLPLITFGQFSKGTKFVGGTVSYFSFNDRPTDDDSRSNTTFNLNNNLGFFVSESFAIGPEIEIYASNNQVINPVTNLFDSYQSSGVMGGIFVRKFFTISELFLFGLEGKGLVGRRVKYPSFGQNEPRSTSFQFEFRPVFTFLPTKNWAFDAGIGGISYTTNSPTSLIDVNRLHVSLGQVTLGVNYFFGMKKD